MMRFWLAGIAAILLIGFVAFSILTLRPPDSLTMAAGAEGGGYHRIAARYQKILAEDGLDLKIRQTAGSAENAALLADPDSGVDVALLQGGVSLSPETRAITLGAIFLEPLWVFHRGALPDEPSLTDLIGLKVAAGPEGSGTRAALLAILNALDLDQARFELSPFSGQAAADALVNGVVDVAIFVAPAEATYLNGLIADPDIRLSSLKYSGAIARMVNDVMLETLPAATLDFSRRTPPRDLAMLAMVGRLVAREDLHPAHLNRLLAAANRIHSRSDVLVEANRFPAKTFGFPPMSRQAEATLTSGPQLVDRVLPYWMAAQINRVAILLLPLLLLIMPVLRALPGIYTWRMRSRIYRHYRNLLTLEKRATEAKDGDERAILMQQLNTLEDEVQDTSLPLRFKEYAYTLRLHIDLIRKRLKED